MIIRLFPVPIIAALYLFVVLFYTIDSGQCQEPVYDGKALEVPLSNDGTVELLQHWTNQAFSGLLAAVATRKKRDLSTQLAEQFHECSKDATTVNKHASCVSKLIKKEYKPVQVTKSSPKYTGQANKVYSTETISSFVVQADHLSPHSIKTASIPLPHKENVRKHNRFSTIQRIEPMVPHVHTQTQAPVKMSRFERLRRKQRSKTSPVVHGIHQTLNRINIRRNKRNIDGLDKFKIVNRDRFELTDEFNSVSPIGVVAKMLKKAVLAGKNKTQITSWKAAVQHVRSAAKQRRKYEDELERRHFDEEADDLEKFAFRGLKHEGIDVEKILNDPSELMSMAKHQKKLKSKEPMRKMLDLLRDGVKLGYQLSGKNVSNFEDKTMKVVSPRFLSVVPEDEDDMISFLSPSLFSLHNEGKGVENLTSLPSLMKTFNGADQQQWLDLIIEAAGVEDQADKLEEDLKKRKEHKSVRNTRGVDGQPMFFSKQNVTERYGDFEKRKIETWEQLMSTYTHDQLHDMNTTGYMVLNEDQLHILYGPQSPFNSSEALERLVRMPKGDEMHQFIEDDIHKIAEMESFNIRQKDIVLSPIILTPLVFAAPIMSQPIVLSPVVLSPVVGTPAVLGPVVLSPWVFVPVILSPRVLSPLILNPLIFAPIVLSPLVLHPLILSPGVFNPIVLSPLVLSPFILSPQVFTPVILSPLVLNPLILNPMVGSPLVLSPFVLSPLILSPQALFAVVLSPYALSPLVASPLALAEVILSPSWLS